MNTIRVDRWTRELNERIKLERGSDPRENSVWLIGLLAEYVKRWVGFSCMKKIGIQSTFDTDSFCIILAALRVINEQLDSSKKEQWFPVVEWDKFENSIDYIQEYPTEDSLNIVTESFNRLWEALPGS